MSLCIFGKELSARLCKNQPLHKVKVIHRVDKVTTASIGKGYHRVGIGHDSWYGSPHTIHVVGSALIIAMLVRVATVVIVGWIL